jgi:hypothetical protein
MAERYRFEASGAHSAHGDETNGTCGAAHILRAGPFNRLQQAVGLMDADNPRTARRAVLFALVSWLPLVILAGVQGLAIDSDPERSMLLDFPSHARFLLAVPLFIVGEVAVDKRFQITADYLVASGIVTDPERRRYAGIISDARRLRDSRTAALFLLLLAYGGSALATFYTVKSHPFTWRSVGTVGVGTLSWAGLWEVALSLPLFQFLLYSSLWTWFVWFIYLWRVSRLKLRLAPTHQDGAGGLNILGDSSYVIAIFVFAIGSVAGSIWAKQIVFYGASASDFPKPIIAYLLFAILFSFGPLLVFSGKLNRLRLSGLRDYGALASRQAHLFDDKWIKSAGPEGQSILGHHDIGSLCDMNNSYRAVGKIKLVPLDLRSIAVIAVAALVPMAPLILMEFPLKEVLKTLVGVIF